MAPILIRDLALLCQAEGIHRVFVRIKIIGKLVGNGILVPSLSCQKQHLAFLLITEIQNLGDSLKRLMLRRVALTGLEIGNEHRRNADLLGKASLRHHFVLSLGFDEFAERHIPSSPERSKFIIFSGFRGIYPFLS